MFFLTYRFTEIYISEHFTSKINDIIIYIFDQIKVLIAPM